MKYIACLVPTDEVVGYFGEGQSGAEALHDFLSNGELKSHCEWMDVEYGAVVDIGVFEAIEPDDPNLDDTQIDLFEYEGFQWILGRKLCEHEVRYTEDSLILTGD